MSETRSNPIWSFVRGVWGLIRFTNHMMFFVLLLVVFLFVVIGLVGLSAGGGSGITPLRDKTALVLNLKGTLVEQYSKSPFERALANASDNDNGRELQLRDLLTAIDNAKDDPKIARIVLLTDGFNVAGFAALRELGSALRDFRAGGKQIVAYGSTMEQKQ